LQLLALNDDPYPSLSLMACMGTRATECKIFMFFLSFSFQGLGLTAVTSSLRLFSNKAVFKRESRAGMSTEAYYLGRMMVRKIISLSVLFSFTCAFEQVHLLVSLVGVFLFTITLFWLVAPRCSFSLLYSVFLLVDLCCSGLGFWTSVILSPQLSVRTKENNQIHLTTKQKKMFRD
jgi:hypothetical protein